MNSRERKNKHKFRKKRTTSAPRLVFYRWEDPLACSFVLFDDCTSRADSSEVGGKCLDSLEKTAAKIESSVSTMRGGNMCFLLFYLFFRKFALFVGVLFFFMLFAILFFCCFDWCFVFLFLLWVFWCFYLSSCSRVLAWCLVF